MRLAICVSIKNRSCVITDVENSLDFVPNKENIVDCEEFKQTPYMTANGKHALFLMPNMLRSLVRQKRVDDDWCIIVVDYGSTDVDMKQMMEYELGEQTNPKIPWILETESVKDYPFFDRGGGLKIAAEIAETKMKSDALFFCDADLFFANRNVFDEAIQSINKGQFFYPIFFSFVLADHTKGVWRDASFGTFATSVENYKKTAGWMHNISWGWEDRALADSIEEEKKDRQRIRGYFHQWHPLKWDFRVLNYHVKEFMFKDACVSKLS